MQTGEFVAAFREAFGPVPELPLLFRYTDEPLRPAAKAGGCFFKALAEARDGRPVGLNASNIGCGGGKFYTGFSPMPEFVPQFVSLKERYKQTPEMVLDFIAALDLRPGPKAWLEFVRVDAAGTFDGAEGVLFFATPDVLAGLVTWAGFDNDAPDAVAAPFGSGCSTVVSQAVRENRNGGHRCSWGCSILRCARGSVRTNCVSLFRCRVLPGCAARCVQAVCSEPMRGIKSGSG